MAYIKKHSQLPISKYMYGQKKKLTTQFGCTSDYTTFKLNYLSRVQIVCDSRSYSNFSNK
ncbi:hypothetical protein BpHYR1_026494 [Brachionus plicatilis]|uniref:Uncharacterized protein n=1 Tax=Brachionus plicatilis TaxID=10195 RepID=A0A3M7QGS0_BRAPC|nr:hypothetical protein BpHYR1_026494 [Brachionus plicatilis]